MQRISISELSTLRWSFYQDAIRYASHGFGSMGVWRHKIDDFDQAAAIGLLFDMKMDVSSVHWAGAFTGCDGKSYSEAISDAEEAIQLAGRLDADCLIIHPGSRNGHTYSHANRLFLTALRTLVPVANDFDVKLAIEPMFGPCASDWTFYQSLKATLELFDEFSHENFGLVLDLYHVGLNSELFNELDKLVDHLVLVQLADRSSTCSGRQELRLPLGTGEVPLERWMRRLQQLGYAASYEIELHGPGMKNMDYFRMLESTRDFLQERSVQSLLELPSGIESSRSKRSSHNS